MAFELLTALMGVGASAYGQRRQIEFAREMAQNAHQYETQDLIKAGLNPILSANHGASAPGIGGIDGSGLAAAGNSAIANKIAKQELENETKKTNAEVDNINANTAQTLAMTPEIVETQKYNRLTTPAKYLNNVYNLLKKMGNSESWKKGYNTLKKAGITPKKEDILNTSFPFQRLKINKKTD